MSTPAPKARQAAEAVPAHDENAERGALASILQPPLPGEAESAAAAIAFDGDLKAEDFYLPRHRELFTALQSLFQRHRDLSDPLFVISELRAAATLDLIGGETALYRHYADAQATSGAEVESFIRRLKGLSAIRRHDHALLRSSSAETVTEQRRYLVEALAALDSIPGTLPTAPPLNIPALLAYDTEHDPNCLLGHRYLCRGGGLLFIGESGLGKSSAIVQAASTWALGNSFFGITPSRPLKSIIIQAENDIGDMSEQVRGVVNGLDLAGAVESLRERVILVPECSLTGSAFVQFARGLALTHKPDLMFADPLLAYLGADVNEQKNVSAFLRNGLNPVGIQVGCGWVIVHHTSKPSRDPKAQTNIRASALSYFGLGSCELTNWARAILVLREIEEDLYELRATKRGGRAGLRESEAPDAGETNAVYIRHGAHGICWERADRMPTEIESAQQAAEAVLEEIAANESMAYEDILERIEKLRKCKRSTAAKFFGEFLTPSTFKVGRFYRRKPL